MSIQIHIDAPNAEAALVEMRQLLEGSASYRQEIGAAFMAGCESRVIPDETPGDPEPVTPAAPAEKKTRSRKAKDVPAVSVSSDDAEDVAAANAALAEFNEKGGTPMAEVKAAISTGEERVGPEDAPEVVAQDEADETAETEAARDPTKPLTLDDVRTAMGAYSKTYGMDAALGDGPVIFKKALGDMPEGTKNARGEVVTEWCLTATPTDQESLGKAVQYWSAALQENPFKREKVAA